MKIGFIGTGLMGQAMVERLLCDRVSVIAYNRTRSKLEPLKTAGAEIANSAAEAIQSSDCSILMLTNATAIQEVVLSEYTAPSLANKTIIQMGTIAPSDSREIHRAVLEKGGDYLEAPVLGSIPEAKAGQLLVMVGGTKKQFEYWSAILQKFDSEPMLIGEVGTAAAMKLALNQLIASLTSAFALSLGFIEQQGVDAEKFMQILRQSALYAPTFDKKLQRMRDRNYDNPNFPTKHLLKDVDLFVKQGQTIGIDVSGLEGTRRIVQKAIDMGLADEDYSAIFSAILP